jgi:hypothetical protein
MAIAVGGQRRCSALELTAIIGDLDGVRDDQPLQQPSMLGMHVAPTITAGVVSTLASPGEPRERRIVRIRDLIIQADTVNALGTTMKYSLP